MGFDYFFELVIGHGEVLDDRGIQVFSQPVKVAVLEEKEVSEGEDEGLVGPRATGQIEEAIAESDIDRGKCLLALEIFEHGEVLEDRC